MNDTEYSSDSDKLSDELRQLSKDPLQSAAALYAAQEIFGREVRTETRKCYGGLAEAHMLVSGVLGSAILRTNGKITPITSTFEEVNALYASFVIGLNLCELAIEEGRYIQACALLRQEMETVAQIKNVRVGKRNPTRAPNIAFLEEYMKRLYGGLSDAAHVSKHHILRQVTVMEITGRDFPEATIATRYFPGFDGTFARRLFALHIMLIAYVIEEMSVDILERLPDDAFTPDDQDAITRAMSLMKEEGMLESF